MDINKKFIELYEEYEKEWHEGHEPQGGHDHYEDIGDVEELEEARTYLDEKFAGWIAFYNKQKLEIKPKKGEIDSLYDAKQAAIKHFKVPKSKQGLLAIKPAQEEARSYIDAKKKEKEKKDYKKKYGREPFSFSGKHMSQKHSMGIAAEFDPKVDESKQDAFVVRYTGKDRKRYAVPYKSQKDADKKAKELKSDGASQIEVEKITLMGFVKFKESVEENYDKNQLLRVQHDERLIAEAGDICSLDRGDLRSKAMQKVYDKKCSPEMIKKKKSIFGKIAKGLDLYNSIGEEKMEKSLIDTVRKVLIGEAEGDKKAYQKFFDKALKKFGIDSPADLKDDKEKKKFYDYIDKNWKADHEEEVSESAALQLKMAFDDAGIKIKGTKGGKLVIAKKDEKKVEKIIAKQMKKPSDAKRILGTQIVFEAAEEIEDQVDPSPTKTRSKLFSHVRKLMSK